MTEPDLPISDTQSLPQRLSGAVNEALHAETDRRTVLRYLGMGCLALGNLGLAEGIARETDNLGHALTETWSDDKPAFELLRGETYSNQTEVGIFLPGFGDMHSAAEAESWLKEYEKFSPDIPIGFISYSNRGTRLDHIVELIRETIDTDQVQSITIFGRSLGGEIAIPVARRLGLPIKDLFLCSSPYRLSDGYYGEFGSLVARLPKSRLVATMAKFAINWWRESKAAGFDAVGENLGKGWHDTMTGAYPIGLQQELVMANEEQLPESPKTCSDAKLEPYRNVLIPGFTTVTYTYSHYPESDQIVHVLPSAKNFEALCSRLQVTYRGLKVPYEGHANMNATLLALANAK